MASSTPHTITLRGDPIASEARAKASEAIKPGMLVELHTDGTLKKHATAKAQANASFVREPDIFGGSVDDTYDDGDTVLFSTFRPGDWVWAWLVDEGNVAVGALLESAGDGSLRAVTAASQSGTTPFAVVTGGVAIAKALEAKDNTGGTGPVRIKVEVL